VYRKIDALFLKKLTDVVGSEFVVTGKENLLNYSKDETEDLVFYPDVVVKPENSLQVSSILKLANEFKIPVTPRGGGTGLSGGSLSVFGGICLSMEKFNKILKVDSENYQAVVEPGVITQVFQEEVEKIGLFYPPDPASRGSCFLGGNLAECSGGPRAVKYGVTKDYILGLEVVLPTGEIIKTGGRVLKNVTGYNLTGLFVGSEGTLGVITKIITRLIPLPKFKKVILVAFNSFEDATESVIKIFQNGITPSAIEFMEKAAVKAAEERQNKKFPNGEAEAQLFIEVDGNYPDALDKDIQSIYEIVSQFNPLDVLLAEDNQKVEDVWALRRGIGEAVKSISPYKEEDTVVPRANMTKLVRGVKEISKKYSITTICYGHSGDGNIHVNILKDKLDDKSWNDNIDKAITEIFELTVSLGGMISGEHGIGFTQKKYLPIALSEAEINIMKKIKSTFDPNNILNPGKIFLD
jgi:glycolate oxidase